MHEEEGWARSNFFSDKARAGGEQARVVGQGCPLLHCLLASQQQSLCCPYLSAQQDCVELLAVAKAEWRHLGF